jgi:hypothetical protein
LLNEREFVAGHSDLIGTEQFLVAAARFEPAAMHIALWVAASIISLYGWRFSKTAAEQTVLTDEISVRQAAVPRTITTRPPWVGCEGELNS